MDKHAHAAVLDRIGFEPLKSYFGITRQTFRNWKRTGVPKRDVMTVKMIAFARDIMTPELETTHD